MTDMSDPGRAPRPEDSEPEEDEATDIGGETPSTEELTGRASKTGDNLAALFDNPSDEHVTDGFRGGSDDDRGVAPPKDDAPVAGEETGTAI
jgi:hypothetical protein